MNMRVARKVLLKSNGYKYGPKAPGYKYGTAMKALEMVAASFGCKTLRTRDVGGRQLSKFLDKANWGRK